jgi:hypothetical protein
MTWKALNGLRRLFELGMNSDLLREVKRLQDPARRDGESQLEIKTWQERQGDCLRSSSICSTKRRKGFDCHQ